MLNKFRRSVRKYPVLFFIVMGALAAYGLDAWNKDGLARGLLLAVSVTALVPAAISMNRTFKSGYYGINLLPVTALITALFLQQGWTAVVLALIITAEKPLIAWLRGTPSELLSASHTSFAKLLDLFSVPFTVMVLLLGGALWVVTGEAIRFLEVIAIASPAPLVLAGPLAFMTGLQQVRTQGIRVRSAGVLERVAFTATVILSKNGVLTNNEPVVDDIKTYGNNSKSDVLGVAAALAGQSAHPLARAIISAAQDTAGTTKAKHAQEYQALGLVGRQRGQTLVVGRAELLESQGIKLPGTLATPSSSIVYVAKNESLIGRISFKDTPKDFAERLAAKFRKLGVRSMILASSDTDKAVEKAARHAGIKEYQSNLLAADKIRLVETAATRPVAFVGHAQTDAAAMTAADVAVAFGEHQPGASDITIEDSNLRVLLNTFKIAKQTVLRARVISFLGLIVTCIFIGFAANDTFSPLQSAGLQALVAFLTLVGATYVRLKATE